MLGHQKQMSGGKKARVLSYGCIAKGKKEGSSNINFMVGISFNKDVVLCEQYFGSITTIKFAKTVENMILMYGYPLQSAKLSLRAIKEIRAVLKTPPLSPSLNPVEDFLNFVSE